VTRQSQPQEIHENRLEIIVQDPNKPKNFDKYTYEKGSVKGPEPVEAFSCWETRRFTADKSRLFDLSEVSLRPFRNVPQSG